MVLPRSFGREKQVLTSLKCHRALWKWMLLKCITVCPFPHWSRFSRLYYFQKAWSGFCFSPLFSSLPARESHAVPSFAHLAYGQHPQTSPRISSHPEHHQHHSDHLRISSLLQHFHSLISNGKNSNSLHSWDMIRYFHTLYSMIDQIRIISITIASMM